MTDAKHMRGPWVAATQLAVTRTGQRILRQIIARMPGVVSANIDGLVVSRATPQALAAVRAVKCAKRWGPLPAFLYARKHGAVSHALAAINFEQRRTKCVR